MSYSCCFLVFCNFFLTFLLLMTVVYTIIHDGQSMIVNSVQVFFSGDESDEDGLI